MICSAVLVFAAAITFCACAPQPTPDPTTTTPRDRDPTEVACEIALVKLEERIDTSENRIGAAALAEARELYRSAKLLYLEREYGLALELIDEAMELLEETDN